MNTRRIEKKTTKEEFRKFVNQFQGETYQKQINATLWVIAETLIDIRDSLEKNDV